MGVPFPQMAPRLSVLGPGRATRLHALHTGAFTSRNFFREGQATMLAAFDPVVCCP